MLHEIVNFVDWDVLCFAILRFDQKMIPVNVKLKNKRYGYCLCDTTTVHAILRFFLYDFSKSKLSNNEKYFYCCLD